MLKSASPLLIVAVAEAQGWKSFGGAGGWPGNTNNVAPGKLGGISSYFAAPPQYNNWGGNNNYNYNANPWDNSVEEEKVDRRGWYSKW